MPFENMITFVDGQVYGATEFNTLRNNIEYLKGITDGINPPFSALKITGSLSNDHNLYTFTYRSQYLHVLMSFESDPGPTQIEVHVGPAATGSGGMTEVLRNTGGTINPGTGIYRQFNPFWLISEAGNWPSGTYPEGIDLDSFASANNWNRGDLLQVYVYSSYNNVQSLLYICNSASILPPSF